MCQPDSARAQPSPKTFFRWYACARNGVVRAVSTAVDSNSWQNQFEGVRFLWLDIEDHAESLGDLDVENFPAILVRRGEWVLFFGVLPPRMGHLRRLVETFTEQTPEESRIYAFSSRERSSWRRMPIWPELGWASVWQCSETVALSSRRYVSRGKLGECDGDA